LSTLTFCLCFRTFGFCFPPKRRHVVSFIKPICRESCIEITNLFALLQKHGCLFIYILHMDVFPLLKCAQWRWWICKPSGYVLSQKFVGQLRIKSHRITAWKRMGNMINIYVTWRTCGILNKQSIYTHSQMRFGIG
jgi:hypothetical protein